MKKRFLYALMIQAAAVTVYAQDSLHVKHLDEVTVLGKTQKYRVENSQTVAKIDLKDLENPQVYNSVPRSLLSDQNVTNMNDALKNATGVFRLWESTGRGGDGAEYYSLRGFSVQPTVVNGMPSISNAALDPANVETVEVIKGPSGALFGGNLISYGGLINVVTKKPYDRLGGEFSYQAGTYGLNRLTADVNVPLSKKMALRLNAASHKENSFQDAGFNKSLFVAPSLCYDVNNRLTFLVNTEFKSSEGANAPMIFLSRYSPLSFSNIDLFEKNYEKSFTNNSLTMKNDTWGIQSQMLYKLSDKWSSQTILSRSNAKSDGYYQYLWDAADGDHFTRFISKRNGETNTTGIQQNFSGDFKIAGVRNRLLLGLDYMQNTIYSGSSGWKAHGIVSLLDGTDTGILTPQAVDNTLLASVETPSTAETEIKSAYISDVINFTPSLALMASVRIDNFNGSPTAYATEEVENQTGISPKLGLTYQLFKDKLSLFANYMNGYNYLDPAEVSDLDGSNTRMKIFDPEQANQWELGFKTSLWKDRFALTASYYNILVSNVVMTDPNNVNNSIQGGEIESKGVELSLIASPFEGMNLIAGYSHNESEVTKDAENSGYIGMRPESAGPEDMFNLWASYKAPKGWLKNFGLGFGANYAGEYATLNRSNIGSFVLPSYTVYNAALSYTTNEFGINLKLDNIGNTKYYGGWSTVTAQKLRSISVLLSYKF